ncbi:MAG: serine hydrolase [Ignavibacteriaceae bacterium]
MKNKLILTLYLGFIFIISFTSCNNNYSDSDKQRIEANLERNDPELEKLIEQIDDEFEGNIGVYAKDLGSGTTVNYKSDRLWYLSSTIKVFVAIAILQKIEAGELSLDDKVILEESGFVDGSGDLILQKPGTSYTIRELLRRMIRNSDSVATDMLIRLMGEDNFNDHISANIISGGVEEITTILQVRYDAYSELHENAAKLSNLDYVKLKSFSPMQNRLNEFIRMASIDKDDLNAKSIPDAFERYYERELNSATLLSLGLMLERLAKGEYLNDNHNNLLLDLMKNITTGDRRIKAGLPNGAVFAQKTGTQIGRAGNMGIIFSDNKPMIVIVVFTEKYNELGKAELAFQKAGRLIAGKWLK